MIRVWLRRMWVFTGGMALILLTVACSTPIGPWAGGASGSTQYASPGGGPFSGVACPGGMAYSERPCGSPWMTTPR